MKLNLTRPLIVFDLETTGLDLVRDRIIQISYIKVMPEGEEIRGNLLVNPGQPIPKEVTELTGISDDDVKDAKSFKELAPQLNEVMTGCDFAGYNSNHFDVPMLAEEFLRAGIDFDSSTLRPYSTRWNAAIWLPHTNSSADARWRTTSRLTAPTRIPKPHTVC